MDKKDPAKYYFENKAFIRSRLLKYTKKAFMKLPDFELPCILDLGCGTGIPTKELVNLSDGYVVGVDISHPLLSKFKESLDKKRYSGVISMLQSSIISLPFKNSVFDIIWGEGVIASVDFEKGIRYLRDFIKDEGCLVLHDDNTNVDDKIAFIKRSGYELLDDFTLSHDVWWYEYYGQLEKIINDISEEGAGISDLDKDKREILMFRKNPERFTSIFFIMQKV